MLINNIVVSGVLRIEERPLRPEKVIVWCVLCPECVSAPYFFENNAVTTVTVNSEHYGHMITVFVLRAIEKYVPHAIQLE